MSDLGSFSSSESAWFPMNETKEAENADCRETDAGEDCHEKAELLFPLTEMKTPHSIFLPDDSSCKTLSPYQ